MTNSAHQRELWMLVDLEPGYERFEPGDHIEVTTFWIGDSQMPGGIPELVVEDELVEVEAEQPDDNRRWCTMGSNFRVLLPDEQWWTGPALLLDGALLYDRYMWLAGHVRGYPAVVRERHGLARRYKHNPLRSEGWFGVEYYGDNVLVDPAEIPPGMQLTWYCIRIAIAALGD